MPRGGATLNATSVDRSPRTRSSTPTHRVLALDGLRGLAVVAVVLYHGGHLSGGFLGVDLFFVLSGFLITSILLRSWSDTRGIDLRRFWSRRARRLLPALLAMLIIAVPIYGIWFATATELTLIRQDGISSLVYVTNWQQIVNNSVYGATNIASPLRHAWSLAVEEQFYLVWPLVVLYLLRRRGPSLVRTVAPVLAASLAAITIAFAAAGTFSLNSLYLGTHSRAPAMLAGASLAAWTAPRRRRAPAAENHPNLLLELGAVGALLVMIFLCVTLDVTDKSLYTGGLVVSALCCTVLVAAAAQPTPGPIVSVLAVRPLRWLGTTSYGIYLWSWPIMLMVSAKHTDLDGWPLFAVQVALTLAAATLSWYLLEKPILAGALPPPNGARVLVAAMVLAFVIVAVVTAGAKPLISTAQSSEAYAGSDTSAPRLLVLGDSVPARIAEEGMIPLADELGIQVVDRSRPGCILLSENGKVKGTEGDIRTEVGPCNDGWDKTVAELEPDVVLVMFGQFANDQIDLGGTFREACDPQYLAAERALLEQGIDQLTSNGARVVLTTSPGTSVSWLLESSPKTNERMACLNDLYAQVAQERDDVDLLDLAPYVCPAEGTCLDTIDGVNLREDTIHFQGEAARLLARWMVPRILGEASTMPDTAAAGATSTTRVRAPYCATVDPLFLTLATTINQEGADLLIPPETIASLRALPRNGLLEDVPPELAGSMPYFAAHMDELIEQVSTLPRNPTAAQLAAQLGDGFDPAVQLTTWYQNNCAA